MKQNGKIHSQGVRVLNMLWARNQQGWMVGKKMQQKKCWTWKLSESLTKETSTSSFMPFLTQMCLCSTPTTSLNSTEMGLNAPCHAPSTPAPLSGFIVHPWTPALVHFNIGLLCTHRVVLNVTGEKCTDMLAVLTLNSGSAVSELSLMMSDPRQTFFLSSP